MELRQRRDFVAVPGNLDALVAPTSLHVDDWVLPSHAQADRVSEGSLDVALARGRAKVATERGLTAHLLYAEPLHAVLPGVSSATPLPAAWPAVRHMTRGCVVNHAAVHQLPR